MGERNRQPHWYDNNYPKFDETNVVFKFLKDISNSDSIEMNVNGSITPKFFDYILVDSNPKIKGTWIARINFLTVNNGMTADNFFGLTALTSGITINVLDLSLNSVLDFTDDAPIKKAVDFAVLTGGDQVLFNITGGADDSSGIRWSLNKVGHPFFLKKGYRIRLTINDDLSALTQFRAKLQGIK